MNLRFGAAVAAFAILFGQHASARTDIYGSVYNGTEMEQISIYDLATVASATKSTSDGKAFAFGSTIDGDLHSKAQTFNDYSRASINSDLSGFLQFDTGGTIQLQAHFDGILDVNDGSLSSAAFGRMYLSLTQWAVVAGNTLLECPCSENVATSTVTAISEADELDPYAKFQSQQYNYASLANMRAGIQTPGNFDAFFIGTPLDQTLVISLNVVAGARVQWVASLSAFAQGAATADFSHTASFSLWTPEGMNVVSNSAGLGLSDAFYDPADTSTYAKAGAPPLPALQTVSSAPEPATWALSLMGLGAVGGMLRHRSGLRRTRGGRAGCGQK